MTEAKESGAHEGRQAVGSSSVKPRLPPWLKVPLPAGEKYRALKSLMRDQKLATVCEEAHCPNVGECWSEGTATIMVLGEVCTRGCRFCAVKTGNPRAVLDQEEPERVALAVESMGLRYVVLTSVDRDDLPDFGAEHYAQCIEAIRARTPEVKIEVLTPDFQARPEAIARIVKAGPDVFAHNLETVERLHRTVRDVRATYANSLKVLQLAGEAGVRFTKSGLMLGLGESKEEILEAMQDLRTVGCELLSLGQYLRPSPKHHAVMHFYSPEIFAELASAGRKMGFRYVASGPLVRSSYKAGEAFVQGLLAS